MLLARHLSVVALIAIIASIFPAVTANVARAGDAAAGKLLVVKAEYGDLPDGKTTDVTEKVKAMVKDNSLNVEASNRTFADPADGAARKKLKVSYTIDGIYRTKTVDEGQTLDISTRLLIRKAVYGGVPSGPSADVTEQVADLVRKNSLTVDASNDLFGDPANGVVKKLRVDYTLDGVDKFKVIAEGETLRIAAKE